MKRFTVVLLVVVLSLSLCVPAAAVSVEAAVENAKGLGASIVGGLIFVAVLFAVFGLVAKRNWLAAGITFLLGGSFAYLVTRPDLFSSLGSSLVSALLG